MSALGTLFSSIYSLFGAEEASESDEAPTDREEKESSSAMIGTSYLLEAEAARQRWALAGVIQDVDLPPQPVCLTKLSMSR